MTQACAASWRVQGCGQSHVKAAAWRLAVWNADDGALLAGPGGWAGLALLPRVLALLPRVLTLLPRVLALLPRVLASGAMAWGLMHMLPRCTCGVLSKPCQLLETGWAVQGWPGTIRGV